MKLRLATLCTFACALHLTTHAPAQAAKVADDLIPAHSRTAAPNFRLSDVQGQPLQLSAYKGRVVLLDFWATTCGGCKVELPWYVDFDNRYRSSGLAVIGIDMYGESPEVIKPFMAQWKMRYPVAVGTDELGEKFGLKEMPLTLLIDRDGKIAVSHAGIVDRVLFAADIQKLLQ